MKDISIVLADIESALLEASANSKAGSPGFAKGAEPGRDHEIIVAIEKKPGEWRAVWGYTNQNRQDLASNVLDAVSSSVKALGSRARAAIMVYEPNMGEWEVLR